MKKQYRVQLKGLEKRSFSLGGGRFLTLLDGALLDEGHEFIKLYPSFVKEVKEVSDEQLLNEDPIGDASIVASSEEDSDVPADDNEDDAKDIDENQTSEDEPSDDNEDDANADESVEDKINAMTTKDEVESFGRELGVELDKRKGLDTMKKILIAEIKGA